MPNKVTYEFAVIRLVPKVEREEFLNVGVILFSKQKNYLDIRYQVNPIKLNIFSNDLDLEMIDQYLEAWALICKGGTEAGKIGELDIALRFRWLVAVRSTIIQSSKTHPGLCTNPEEVLEQLYERHVL